MEWTSSEIFPFQKWTVCGHENHERIDRHAFQSIRGCRPSGNRTHPSSHLASGKKVRKLRHKTVAAAKRSAEVNGIATFEQGSRFYRQKSRKYCNQSES
ncbi:hypothetical protein Rcae01_05290 [Novipirellula caenicola]|uniref:Uncharacterized protein n=1 Tax=Novipirellula caenicola TaxID=1536901 RepID=A0ABP9VXB8_9BACT